MTKCILGDPVVLTNSESNNNLLLDKEIPEMSPLSSIY